MFDNRYYTHSSLRFILFDHCKTVFMKKNAYYFAPLSLVMLVLGLVLAKVNLPAQNSTQNLAAIEVYRPDSFHTPIVVALSPGHTLPFLDDTSVSS